MALNGVSKIIAIAGGILGGSVTIGGGFFWAGQRIAFEESAVKVHEQVAGALASQAKFQNEVFGPILEYVEEQKKLNRITREVEDCVEGTGMSWEDCFRRRVR